MKTFQLESLLTATHGKLLYKNQSVFQGIGTDTRKDLKGKFFIALKGEAFDAHDYLLQAIQAGATGVMVDHIPDKLKSTLEGVTVIQVNDTLEGLQSLGSWVRKQSSAKILGLTGSNGKTTTKEFTAQILSTQKNVHWSQGSFNNHWGVPFSLLDLEPQHEVAVIEMGMNHFGEIQRLVQIADPDVVVCTMVGRAHIEFFGTQEKIAQAKQEIYLHSRPNSIAIFNLDNPLTRNMWEQEKRERPSRPLLTFSENEKADVQMQLMEANFNGLVLKGEIAGVAGQITVPIFGKQNVTNLLAASSLALAAGLSPDKIWNGLLNCQSHWGRNQKVKLSSGALALFDAYNANPDSMEALILNVRDIKAPRKVAVLGQMKELGELAGHFHEQLGQQVGKSGFDKVIFYGEDHESFARGLQKSGYKGLQFVEADFSDSLAEKLTSDLQAQDLIVFKASRGMRMERMLLACEPLDFKAKN